jgi:cytochrome b subunit of formate dehydrogenase
MRAHNLSAAILTGLILLAGMWGGCVEAALIQGDFGSPDATEGGGQNPENAACLGCHGIEGFAFPSGDGEMRQLHVSSENFGQSVHGMRSCVECHKDISQIPHRNSIERKVDCITCHKSVWEENGKPKIEKQEPPRIGVVVQQIEHYMGSIHAQPNKEDPLRPNANCYDCHDAHYVYPITRTLSPQWKETESEAFKEMRLKTPDMCAKCHPVQRNQYLTSVHGREVTLNENPSAAVCIDCHTAHQITRPKGDPFRLEVTKNCGGCHNSQLETYMSTYHGQVNTLGYAHTAKCFDCHGHHEIQRVDDEASIVHKKNRLKTCQKCHENATAGFVTFEPHGNRHDFGRFPYMWVTSKFMIALLSGVFAFFWTHMGLWFYREYKDRKQGKTRPHVEMDKLGLEKGKYVRRFGRMWRLVHLLFAIGIMTLALTGTGLLYAESFWAPTVMKLLGGPEVAGLIHRIGAATFTILFLGNIAYLTYYMIRNRKTFKLFGPVSLMPNLQDFRDIAAMFKWFVGKRSRPIFDHWTYWEKFDYWAPFWGMVIIGISGFILWFPEATASVLPGRVFNVATILHGEEAFLAIVFLFTVHYFNSHFRPDKFPQDIVMFTGALPLEEFKRDHTLEYRRLVETGELEKYLVDAPSRLMTLSSKILGAFLIIFGLMLLILVLLGFWEKVLFG